MYKHYLQLQKPTLRYHDLRVHPYARFKTNKPKDVRDTPAQDGGSGSVVGFSTSMLEAGKENVGGIGTRQECGDALPRCNLACGLRLWVAPHTPHLTSLSLVLALCYPTLMPWLEAWLGFPRAASTSSHAIVFPRPIPELGGELYSVVTSWHATAEDATHISG